MHRPTIVLMSCPSVVLGGLPACVSVDSPTSGTLYSGQSGVLSQIHTHVWQNLKSLLRPANAGLAAGDMLDPQNNFLCAKSVTTYIPQLQARGVGVLYDWTPQAYDANCDGAIQRSEAAAALIDYFNLKLSRSQVVQVLTLYFGGGS